MTGAQFLDFIVGKSGQIGMLQKNVNDTSYRAFMLSCLNLVLKDISNRQQQWHWRWLEKTATAPTVASQHTYDVPSDLDTNKILAVYERTNDITMKFMPYDKFVRLVADPSADSGNAVIWTFYANTLRLYPVPSAVLTMYMDYIKTITALADSAGTTDVPAKYDTVIIDGALVYAYKFDKNMGDWAKQQVVFEAGVTRMIQDNNMSIGELAISESHRTRIARGTLEGAAVMPLDD